MGADKNEKGAEAVKTRKPRQTKAQKEEDRRAAEAAALDRSNAERYGVNNKLTVLETVELDPDSLRFDSNIQGRAKEVDESGVLDLADSMRTEGQLHPIQVRKEPNGEYTVIFGNTRGRAAQKIKSGYPAADGKGQIPANPEYTIRAEVVDVSDDEAFRRNVSENVHRRNTSPIDDLYNQERLRESGLTDVAIAQLYGYKGSGGISRLKKLKDFPHRLKDAVHSGEITLAAAFILADLPSEAREVVYDRVVASKLEADSKLDAAKLKEKNEEDPERVKIGASEVAKAARQWRAENAPKKDEAKPEDGGETVSGGEGGESAPAAASGGEGKSYSLSVKQIKEGLRQLAGENAPPKASQLFGLMLDWVEGKSADTSAIADFVALNLAE